MGSMSASDAAPLPRLGEVFFDVRGSSRSMRLSWYADTGISVFSIWQGGTCTGTFRLPQEELPRLIDALQRGMYPDPRGTGGVARQFPGVPTDPRLTALPGYAGVRDFGREGDFTGPVTGDFRALRPEDQAGTMMLGSAGPRAALPPGGGHSDQSRYPERAQYREQGYAQPVQGQYQDQAGYATQPQYADQAYADQAYSDQGYPERYGAQGSYEGQAPQPGQQYDDRRYLAPAEQGYQGYGYGEPASAGRAYAGSSYDEPTPPGLAPLGQGYSGQQYDSGGYASQGYDDRAYQQQGYQGQAYSEQGYPGYGYADRGGPPFEASGRYRSQEGVASPGDSRGYASSSGSGGYGQQGYAERGYGQHGYPEDVGQPAPDQGYDQYGYSGQDYRDQGYATQGEAYPEQAHGGYDYAGDQRNGSYPASYDQGSYDRVGPTDPRGPGDSRGYESGGYGNRGYDGTAGPGYDTTGYGNGSYGGPGGPGYDGAGYSGGNGNSGYGGVGYDDGPARSGGYRQVPAGSGSPDRPQYDDQEATPSQPMSSFPYDGGAPPDREHRRRRRR
jgi:hypothetical protein